jgi:hypothetical protein
MATAHMSQTIQKLPAGLAGVLNGPDDHRDSAYYSAKDPSSKRERPPSLPTVEPVANSLQIIPPNRAMVTSAWIPTSHAPIPRPT